MTRRGRVSTDACSSCCAVGLPAAVPSRSSPSFESDLRVVIRYWKHRHESHTALRFDRGDDINPDPIVALAASRRTILDPAAATSAAAYMIDSL